MTQSKGQGRISRRGFLIGAAAAAAGAGGLAYGVLQATRGGAQRQEVPEVVARRIAQPVPATDPLSSLWGKAEEVEVALTGQMVIMPFRREPAVASIRVRALHDGSQIAFRLHWPDDSHDQLSIRITDFRDACAVFLGPYPAPESLWFMGTKEAPVTIMQWRADWQKDMDEGFQDLEVAFPNVTFEYYPPLAKGPWPPKPQDYPAGARIWLPGWAVGNPLSQPEKATPVQKLMGIGPGTLEPFPTQNAVGKGVWQDGRWLVSIGRPLTAADDGEIPLSPGKMYSLAFALWMGSAKDRGARKSITQLGRLTLEA